MDFPEIFIYTASESEEDAAANLATTLNALDIDAPFVVASKHGARLAAAIGDQGQHVTPGDNPDQARASELGARAHEIEADAIVAIGGGRCLDVAKLAAARAGLNIVTVPTQLSHDGICSPVAVVPNEDGIKESIGAVAPRAVFASMPTLASAPADSLRAGIGDILANPLALRDWALAAERGMEKVDGRAWDLSVESFEGIEKYLDTDVAKSADGFEFLGALANSLVLSGMAMITSGTSRPASGGEHEISHSIDELHGGRALHGAQVAFGCIVSAALYGDDTDAFRRRLRTLGLPHHPRDLGLSNDELHRVILHAPDTRPGRFTVLEDANLDSAGVTELIRRIWDD